MTLPIRHSVPLLFAARSKRIPEKEESPMSEYETTTVIAPDTGSETIPQVSDQVAEPAEDLLVEEVSIDGMCGVY